MCPVSSDNRHIFRNTTPAYEVTSSALEAVSRWQPTKAPVRRRIRKPNPQQPFRTLLIEKQNIELLQILERLTDLCEQYQALLDLSPQPLISLDEQGYIDYTNLAAANFLGLSREALFRQPLESYISSKGNPDIRQDLGQLIEQETPLSLSNSKMQSVGSHTPVRMRVREVKKRNRNGRRSYAAVLEPKANTDIPISLDSSELLSLMRSAITAFSTTQQQDMQVRHVLCEILKLCDVDAGCIWLTVQEDLSLQAVCKTKGDGNSLPNELPQPLKNLADEARVMQDCIYVPDIGTNAFSNKHMFQSLAIRSCLCVPLISRDKTIGVLQLFDSRAERFTARDVAYTQVIGTAAAFSIENSLTLQNAVDDAVTRERISISQQIHDTFSQSLYATHLVADNVLEIWRNNPEDGIQALVDLRADVRDMLSEYRSFILEIRSETTDKLALYDEISDMSIEFAKRSGIEVEFDSDGSDSTHKHVCMVFYRVCQEALTNILKHSGASKVHVNLQCADEAITLEIADDGCGFNGDGVRHGHFGIDIMRERADEIGAQLEICSQPETGTTVVLKWHDSHNQDFDNKE